MLVFLNTFSLINSCGYFEHDNYFFLLDNKFNLVNGCRNIIKKILLYFSAIFYVVFLIRDFSYNFYFNNNTLKLIEMHLAFYLRNDRRLLKIFVSSHGQFQVQEREFYSIYSQLGSIIA